MKIMIVGQAIVATSGLKFDTLKRAATVLPESLVLKNEEKEPIFAIGIGPKPSVSKSGITYNAADSTGLAQLTLPLPEMAADKRKQYVEDNYGAAFVLAAKAESAVEAALGEHAADIQAVLGEMEVR